MNAIEVCAHVIAAQQRSLWPLVGATLPWFFGNFEGERIFLVPTMIPPRLVGAQEMGKQTGPIQYCLEAEMNGRQEVLQVPVGNKFKELAFSRDAVELYYFAFTMREENCSCAQCEFATRHRV